MAWWSRLSVRGRLTFAVTVASAVALLTLSWLTMAWLRQALVNQVEVRNSAALEATYTPIKKNPNAMIDKIEQANDFGPLPTVTRLELGAVPSDTLAAVAYEPATPAGLVATDGDELIKEKADYVLYVPDAPRLISPIISVIPLQLLAYMIAVWRGADVDQPRNLAKSVTVE
mgnify:CR=1 FL=1